MPARKHLPPILSAIGDKVLIYTYAYLMDALEIQSAASLERRGRDGPVAPGPPPLTSMRRAELGRVFKRLQEENPTGYRQLIEVACWVFLLLEIDRITKHRSRGWLTAYQRRAWKTTALMVEDIMRKVVTRKPYREAYRTIREVVKDWYVPPYLRL